MDSLVGGRGKRKDVENDKRDVSYGAEFSATEMFELNTGVRQGCVMSPVLFSLFINGLAKEINKRTKGICVGDRKVRLLMYADDIVLMSETKRDLQNMLDVVTTYSKKWRFRLNLKKGKSEVMIFGRKPRKTGEDRIWEAGRGGGTRDRVIQVPWSGAGESARLQETKAAICRKRYEAGKSSKW